MKSRHQNVLVIFVFMMIIGAIAYPVVFQQDPLLATPTNEMHLKIDQTEGNEDTLRSDKDEISAPIFKEN